MTLVNGENDGRHKTHAATIVAVVCAGSSREQRALPFEQVREAAVLVFPDVWALISAIQPATSNHGVVAWS